MTHSPRIRAWSQIVPIAFIALFFAWPVCHALVRFARWPEISRLATDESLRSVAWFTVWQAVVSTGLTLLVAMPVTWAVSRWTVPGHRVIHGLITAPFLMPAVVVATGVAAVLPDRGIPSILWAHAVFNSAVVLHIVGPRWRMIARDMEDAAADLGAGPWETFRRVIWPQINGAVVNAASIVFAFCFSSFAVVSILGGSSVRTLETEVFTQSVRLGDFRTATAVAVIQTAVVIATLWFGNSGLNASSDMMTSTIESPRASSSGSRTAWFPAIIAWSGSLVVIAPLLAVGIRSVRHGGSWNTNGWSALFNGSLERVGVDVPRVLLTSARFALATALIATVLALLIVRRGRPSFVEHLSLAPIVVSAVTLGLGLVVTFDRSLWNWRGATWLVPVIHSVVALPLAVRTVASALRGIDSSIFDAAADLGATGFRTWAHVELPLLRPAILQAAAISAAVSIGEFGATSFLTRSDSMTVPIAIGQLMGRPGALLQQSAFALATLVAVIVTVGHVIRRLPLTSS